MQWKSYEAESIQEAMAMIKKEMGEDAVILSTSRKGRSIEVVAARDGDDIPARLSRQMAEKRTERRWVPEERSEIGELQNAVASLFDILGTGGRGRGDALAPLYQRLVAGGMSHSGACQVTEGMRGHGMTDALAALRSALPVYDKKRRIRVLVGPTGAGKTTTLAKLAAETAFGEKRDTAIITTDTHRIAATEQIRIYAQIMDIPMAIAPDRASYVKAVGLFANKEVIYVDTPGRAYADKESLELLNGTLRACEDTEASLVLSMTSTREHLLRSVLQYGIFDSTNIIFTKLDECTRYGAIYDVVEKTGLPVSYVTMGQNVPEDIEKATPERIAELILGR